MNLNSSLSAVLLSVAAVAPVAPAHAAVIDFEDVGFVPCTDSPIVSGGFTFSGNDFFHCVVPAGLPTPGANNGSSFLIEGSSYLTVANNAALPFALRALSLGTSFFNETSPNLMTITGARTDGSTITRTVIVSDAFQRFHLSDFNNLVAVTFSGLLLPDPGGSHGYFAIDNLAVQIPLPGTAPLALLGLGMLAAARGITRPRAAA
jgi:hypothetical protein